MHYIARSSRTPVLHCDLELTNIQCIYTHTQSPRPQTNVTKLSSQKTSILNSKSIGVFLNNWQTSTRQTFCDAV